MKDAVLTLELSGVGIVAVRTPKAEANADTVQRVEVELYAEQLKVIPGGGEGGGTKTTSAEPAPKTEAAAPEAAPAPVARPVRRAR